MPINFRFEGKLIWLELLGTYTIEELKRSFAEAVKNPMFPDEMCLLIDESKSIALEKRSLAEVKDIGQYMANSMPGHVSKVAILVNSQKQLEFARMAGSYANPENLNVQIFSDQAEAVNWLEAKEV